MSTYLNSFEFNGSIKKENVDKLNPEFFDYFGTEEDDDGNIINIYNSELKFNFEDVVDEACPLFEHGSTMDMTDEYSSPFRWILGGEHYFEVNGYIVYPESDEDIKAVKELQAKIEANLKT